MPEIYDIDIGIKQKRQVIVDNEKGHKEKMAVTLKNEDATITILGDPWNFEKFIQGQTVTLKISQVQTQISQDDDPKGEEIEGEDINEDKELEGENPFGEDEHIPEEDLENA